MDFFVFAIVILSIHFCLWFFDSFFKVWASQCGVPMVKCVKRVSSLPQSCMHYPYEAFLTGTGLTVRPFRVQWYTTALNRLALKWANSYPRLFTRSFDVGVVASSLLLPLVIGWHFVALYRDAAAVGKPSADPLRSQRAASQVELDVMLPGVNLPLDEIGFYITALAVCSIVHEVGHALAAVLEDVPLNGFGVQVFLAFPVAFTELATEQLNGLRPWRKLRVFCAGVWHNILLAILALAMWSIIFLPFYTVDSSVSVIAIKPDSPLSGDRGLAVGDVITHINECRVRDAHTWYGCLANTIRNPPSYCIPSSYVLEHDESVPVYHSNEGVTECCDRNNPKNLCFEYQVSEDNHGLVELPQFMCLNIRKTIENAISYCHGPVYGHGDCVESFCIKPMMNNATTLMRIKRSNGNDVFFIGHPSDLAFTVKISGFVPKTILFSASIAEKMSLLLKYLVVFSLGLAVVNVIPCFYFDGYYITNTLTNLILSPFIDRNNREFIAMILKCLGTGFFIIAITRSLWHSVVLKLI